MDKEKSDIYKKILEVLLEQPKVQGFDVGNDEADMARTELRSIIDDAEAIADMIDSDTDLDAWVQSKITKSADYLSSVHKYMKGRPSQSPIEESVGKGGVAYEKKVEKVIDQLEKKFSGFRKLETAGGAFSNVGSGDMSFQINGRQVNMEIKMNAKAQMGGTSVGYEREDLLSDPEIGKMDKFDWEKINPDDVPIFYEALKPIMRWLDALIDHFANLPDPFYKDVTGFPLNVKTKDWERAVELGYVIPSNKKLRFDSRWIREHYTKKNVHYIQIGGIGLLHTGVDVLGLGVPMLEGQIDIEMRPGAGGSRNTGIRPVGYRLQGRLKLESSGKKSPVSLDDYNSAVAGFKKILK